MKTQSDTRSRTGRRLADAPPSLNLSVFENLFWGWKLAFNANRRFAALWLLVSISAGIAPMVLLLAARWVLNQVLEDRTTPLQPEFHMVWPILGAALGVYVLTASGNWLRVRVAGDARRLVNQRLFSSVNQLPPSTFENRATQNLIHRARSESTEQPSTIFEASGRFIQAGLFFLVILAYLARQSWLLPALLVLVSLPTVAIYGRSTILSHRSRQRETFIGRMASYLGYLLCDARVIPELRQSGGDTTFSNRHDELLLELGQGENDRGRYELIAALASGLFMGASLLCGFWVTLNLFAAGSINSGNLILVFYTFLIAHRMAGTVLEASVALYRGALFLTDLRLILDSPDALHADVAKTAGKSMTYVPVSQVVQDLKIRDLRFTFPGKSTPCLDGVNLTLSAGCVTVLTGPNGCGKSTLLRLVARLYQPDSGELLLDDQLVTNFDLQTWRNQVAVMFQDFAKFPGTLKENVQLDREEAQPHWAMSRQVGQLDPLLANLPEQEYTLLDRQFGGMEISGGQWQKIALARMIATNARILLMDEPTSSLDPLSRQIFWDQITPLSKGRIILVASHDERHARERGLRIVNLPELIANNLKPKPSSAQPVV